MPVDPDLRAELLAMAASERRLRESVPPSVATEGAPEYSGERRDLDALHAARLWEILDDLECWPGRSVAGDDGAEAAWSLAQHARYDPELQRRCLEMLEVAVDCEDAPAVHHALLLDGVRMAEGRAQVFGSQLVRRCVDNTADETAGDVDAIEPWPIENPSAVDVRRAAVGLEPLAAYVATMRRHYTKLLQG